VYKTRVNFYNYPHMHKNEMQATLDCYATLLFVWQKLITLKFERQSHNVEGEFKFVNRHAEMLMLSHI